MHVFVFADGSKYTGEAVLHDGTITRHGTGVFKHTNGTNYAGEWKHDHMHGQGR